MVARKEKSQSHSPCFNVHMELDNKALKAKNTSLTQAVAKLQQDNAELAKQITFLQQDSFEIKSKYNNLKNVISIIDSTTKTCLPKLNEVVETFTGIIQLCTVASHISNSNRDTRTQAVKPQIVNGHVLHNPTITLSRLDNDDTSYTPPRASTSRISSNIIIRPSTSQDTNEIGRRRNTNLNGSQEEDSDNENEDDNGSTEEMDTSYRSEANRGVCRRKQSSRDIARLQEDDLEEERLETMSAAEEETEEVNFDDECDPRLTTIREEEEEEEVEEDMSIPLSPESRQRRFLKGRLQEVRIYLNQLPTAYIEQLMGSDNISISVSPPDRRSSFKQRPSSLVGESNDSFIDNRQSFLDENLSVLNRSVRLGQENLAPSTSNSQLSLTFENTSAGMSAAYFDKNNSNCSHETTLQFSRNLSPIPILNLPSTSRNSIHDSPEIPSLTLQESTPLVSRRSNENLFNRSDIYKSLNKSSNSEKSLILTNVTKRKVSSREKNKIAQVLLNRLSVGNETTGSPIDGIKDMVNSPPITRSSKITRSRGRTKIKATNSQENTPNYPVKTERRDTVENETPGKSIANNSKNSPVRRPKRAARPTTLKEPNLNKKMRRSK